MRVPVNDELSCATLERVFAGRIGIVGAIVCSELFCDPGEKTAEVAVGNALGKLQAPLQLIDTIKKVEEGVVLVDKVKLQKIVHQSIPNILHFSLQARVRARP